LTLIIITTHLGTIQDLIQYILGVKIGVLHSHPVWNSIELGEY